MRHVYLLGALLLGCSSEEDTAEDTGASASGLHEQDGAAGGGLSPQSDAPVATVSINSGAAWANKTSVTLAIGASSGTPTHMCISNSTTCSSWATYKTSKTWTISSGAGTKTVYVWLKDAEGNVSASPASDSISLDTTKPANGTLTGAGESDSVSLYFYGFTDTNGSGIASYKVAYKVSPTTVPAGCTSGENPDDTQITPANNGTAFFADVSDLTNGTTYNIRVCAVDTAGNASDGATITLRPAPEFDLPTGTVSINGGAAWAGSTSATLTLSASDPSETAISKMCLSNTTTCTSWVNYSASKSWTLKTGSGERTVYVKFRDAYNNESTTYATDTINLDTTKPTNGTVIADPGSGYVDLSWSDYTDGTGSGIVSYKVYYKTGGTAPSACSSSAGTLVAEGFDETNTTHDGVTPGTTYSYRVCAVDAVGNVSSGAKVSVTAQ